MNAEEQRVHDKAMDLVCKQGDELASVTKRVREIHETMKRGEATQDHGLDGNLRCILDHVCNKIDRHHAEKTFVQRCAKSAGIINADHLDIEENTEAMALVIEDLRHDIERHISIIATSEAAADESAAYAGQCERIADAAAWTLIEGGTMERADGWHDFDAMDTGSMADYETWIAYLESRKLIERHATEPWVRPLADGAALSINSTDQRDAASREVAPMNSGPRPDSSLTDSASASHQQAPLGVFNARHIWVNEFTEGEFAGCFNQFVHDSRESAQEGARGTTKRTVEFVEVHSQ